MNMVDLVAIGVKTLRLDSGCSLEKNFTKLIDINPLILLCQNVNQVDSCHSCVRDTP